MTATMPHGAPAWADSVTEDFERDLACYTAVFGWSPLGFGAEVEHYVDFHVGAPGDGGLAVAGLVGSAPGFLPGVPSRWTVYFRVPDCGAAVARATALGAGVVIGAAPVGEDLVYALLDDPSGAHFGLFEIRSDGAGFQTSGGTGAPVRFTFGAADLAASVDFYRRLFDWTVTGDEAQAALTAAGAEAPFGDMRAGAPATGWVAYYGVDSVEEAVARANQHGGALVHGPSSADGRLSAELAAPSGARFGIAGPPTAGP
ncbi:VOC family protein [Glycomyces endophyticus]|uniref:VOC family protein n=1 Tax=Glycomyces endophyticus TaxID=480996 RepID=A0ABP4SIA9_9ACTN